MNSLASVNLHVTMNYFKVTVESYIFLVNVELDVCCPNICYYELYNQFYFYAKVAVKLYS